MHVKYNVPKLYINRLPEDEPKDSKHSEEIKKLKIKILI